MGFQTIINYSLKFFIYFQDLCVFLFNAIATIPHFRSDESETKKLLGVGFVDIIHEFF